jgi:serine/threonine protein kinase
MESMEWSNLIGRSLGDNSEYEIIAELGRGGSSHNYRAWDRVGEREVAVKVIPNDAGDRQGFARRFEREVQAFAQLHHPNIVEVYGNGETDELVYLVMQRITGGTLHARLGRPLPISEAAEAIIQMAQALHHAHQHGVIHRDVKPANMLVDEVNPRRLLLTDFGIAKIEGMRGLTATAKTIGTPEYMAPEQAEGRDVDHRADIYALGCVLYEALTGRPPFVGPKPVAVLYQQVHVRPPYLRGLNPQVPRDPVRECTCSPSTIARYQKRLSGPLLGRIDIHVEVPRVEYEQLTDTRAAGATLRWQPHRLQRRDGPAEVRTYCEVEAGAQPLLRAASQRLQLSARAFHRVLKLARTIADLAEAEVIQAPHLAEALQYRARVEVG